MYDSIVTEYSAGRVRCPAVTETAHCYQKPCNIPYNLNNNVNKWVSFYELSILDQRYIELSQIFRLTVSYL